MDLSNEPYQQNIPPKRGRYKGLDYSNLQTLEPHDNVLQFTHARCKKTTECVAHGKCRRFGHQKYIPHNELRSSLKQQAIIHPFFKLIVLDVSNL